ncbi:unnamed protein product [Pseudo-nitzschia multistriata]|uniref:Uncharacterized protein n=1 Tax=Pseudo-nitzschia multistriata TaxID=183589 RepID=A0A448ZHB2_9STRA|nr:unnamed protein product [Pseudo-nitzschia multistriata]
MVPRLRSDWILWQTDRNWTAYGFEFCQVSSRLIFRRLVFTLWMFCLACSHHGCCCCHRPNSFLPILLIRILVVAI